MVCLFVFANYIFLFSCCLPPFSSLSLQVPLKKIFHFISKHFSFYFSGKKENTKKVNPSWPFIGWDLIWKQACWNNHPRFHPENHLPSTPTPQQMLAYLEMYTTRHYVEIWIGGGVLRWLLQHTLSQIEPRDEKNQQHSSVYWNQELWKLCTVFQEHFQPNKGKIFPLVILGEHSLRKRIFKKIQIFIFCHSWDLGTPYRKFKKDNKYNPT